MKHVTAALHCEVLVNPRVATLTARLKTVALASSAHAHIVFAGHVFQVSAAATQKCCGRCGVCVCVCVCVCLSVCLCGVASVYVSPENCVCVCVCSTIVDETN